MAGFRKANNEQAALKIGAYGAPGSGKTFTSLLLAEGLAKREKKRVAYIDTERGTDFYCQKVKERSVHPEAFDFDVLYTRSLVQAIEEVNALDPAEYGVGVIDSISHLWDAAINAYAESTGCTGEIPAHAWGDIKRPYKQLMAMILSSPIHWILCGRETDEYEAGEQTGRKKMRAEKETAHEPHLCFRMQAVKIDGVQVNQAVIEKDRTGLLTGKVIDNPNFDKICTPLLPYLGKKQGVVEDEKTVAAKDAEAISVMEERRAQVSASTRDEYRGKILMAKNKAELLAIGKEITPAVKKLMAAADEKEVRLAYLAKQAIMKD